MGLTSKILPSGTIIAQDVAEKAFLETYTQKAPSEWINGSVIDLPLHDETCKDVQGFLTELFRNYFSASGQAGQVGENALFKTPETLRRPDVIVYQATDQSHTPVEQALLIVEISTPESHRRDRVEKFLAYEMARVPEYWVIDMATEEVLFYHLNDNGLYELAELDEAYLYHSTSLPKLQISPDIFWQEPLPDSDEVIALAKAMLR
ncbi:Uma2 family endonuclease [Phototrophicus methaneseepsis]|uniref:Uma2 family endonuclease n=1 Tax=Phototrophicus methaneseepsis TaxID=2710758 RepID=A0A7S8EDY1_9CHLR|nr:Uma2 family endonuclease [Phototrophicus methaneseepsis]QPC85069.1 Uma2 family endonuclease [Phototrophicus methaneseepsis]